MKSDVDIRKDLYGNIVLSKNEIINDRGFIYSINKDHLNWKSRLEWEDLELIILVKYRLKISKLMFIIYFAKFHYYHLKIQF